MASDIALSCSVSSENLFGPVNPACWGGFDFTLLFEETILTIIPLGLLLLLLPFRLWYLLKHSHTKVHTGLLHRAKLVGFLAYAIIQLALLGLLNKADTPKTSASIACTALTFIAALGLALLSHLEHSRNVRPSTLLSLFLFITLVFDIARTRTLWGIPDNNVVATTFLVSVICKGSLLLLESTPKRKLLYSKYAKYPPEAIVGPFDRSFFWWLNPLLLQGYMGLLTLEKLIPVDKALAANPDEFDLRDRWQNFKWKETPHMFTLVCMMHYGKMLAAGIIPRLALTGFTFCQPFLVERTISYVVQFDYANRIEIGYGLIGATALVYIGIAISTALSQHKTYRFVTQLRAGLVSLLYERTLELSSVGLDEADAVTLMSADVERISTGLRQIHELWADIVEIALSIWLLQGQLELATIAAAAVTTGCTAAAVKVASNAGNLQKLWLDKIQVRVAQTASMLGTMKGVKMSGLVDKVSAMIRQLREEEIKSSWSYRVLLVKVVNLTYASTALTPVAAFGLYTLLSKFNGYSPLDTEKVFTSLALIQLLLTPVSVLIETLAGVMSAVGSFERIRVYINSTSRNDRRTRKENADMGQISFPKTAVRKSIVRNSYVYELAKLKPLPEYGRIRPSCVVLQNASAGWEPDRMAFSNLNCEIRRSELTMIIGPVGSGKSTLLNAILGETPYGSGTIQVDFAEAAYCAQQPWLTNGTVRQNIIGDSEFDKKWYRKVLSACALETDIQQLPLGDHSKIGSKGTTLSGGQQMRVALARAVYSRKKVVILDDILAGLDANTEETVFDELLGPQGLLRRPDMTVIMVTNAVHRLSAADHIIALGKDGRLVEQGSFNQLYMSSGYIGSLNLRRRAPTPKPVNRNQLARKATNAAMRVSKVFTLAEAAEEESERKSPPNTAGDITVYGYYIETFGWVHWGLFFILCGFYGFGTAFPQVWANWWAQENDTDPNGRALYYFLIYLLLAVLTIISLISTCCYLVMVMVPRASRILHARLLTTVLNAPMSFFTSTDTGNITNRFSQDMELIDMELPLALINTALTLFILLAQAMVIAVSGKYVAAAIPFSILIVYIVQLFYLRTSRQLRLMDIEAKSALFTNFLEALSGLVTIRAFGWQKRLLSRNNDTLNLSQRPFYLLFCVQRWLGLVLDLIVGVIALILVIIAVATKGHTNPGFIGLALVNIVGFSASLKQLITNWTLLETAVGSVSRVRSFTMETESENCVSESQTPPPEWPSRGQIEFRDMTASYKDSPVLKNISFKVKPGQKIGICGRSGSGKSSLIASLFRMIEIDSGSILIDGLDLSLIRRQEIRSRIVAMPQDPYLLHGTIRYNVDPLELRTDDVITRALIKVNLWDLVAKHDGLDTVVTPELLSQGQRQLLCLARAMMRDSSILVLDEATASVDVHTDELMQRIIRNEFKNRTIVAVAHRLDTIMDFDLVAVMDAGRLIELGSPAALLEDESSAFRDLYRSYKGEVEGGDGNGEGEAGSAFDEEFYFHYI
ncbi:hypothetical protein VTN77DRAFT_9043 [Rasamsonia byssochlamydoides]|uniref:uncharacterized protein n=1 Tax=Rasamsonia byssochlamydoides TaxID=89139 RepID=UPI0037434C46